MPARKNIKTIGGSTGKNKKKKSLNRGADSTATPPMKKGTPAKDSTSFVSQFTNASHKAAFMQLLSKKQLSFDDAKGTPHVFSIDSKGNIIILENKAEQKKRQEAEREEEQGKEEEQNRQIEEQRKKAEEQRQKNEEEKKQRQLEEEERRRVDDERIRAVVAAAIQSNNMNFTPDGTPNNERAAALRNLDEEMRSAVHRDRDQLVSAVGSMRETSMHTAISADAPKMDKSKDFLMFLTRLQRFFRIHKISEDYWKMHYLSSGISKHASAVRTYERCYEEAEPQNFDAVSKLLLARCHQSESPDSYLQRIRALKSSKNFKVKDVCDKFENYYSLYVSAVRLTEPNFVASRTSKRQHFLDILPKEARRICMVQCGAKDSYSELKTVAIRWDLARKAKSEDSDASSDDDESDTSETHRQKRTRGSNRSRQKESLSMAAVNAAIQRALADSKENSDKQTEVLSLAAIEGIIEKALVSNRSEKGSTSSVRNKRNSNDSKKEGGQSSYEEWVRKRPCWHCGRPGHNKQDCDEKHIIDHPNSIICEACGRKGHTKTYCHKKKRKNSDGRRPHNVNNNDTEERSAANSVPLGKRRKKDEDGKGDSDKSD